MTERDLQLRLLYGNMRALERKNELLEAQIAHDKEAINMLARCLYEEQACRERIEQCYNELVKSYNTVVNVANSQNRVTERASALLDKVDAYVPVLATGDRIKNNPGRKSKVSDDDIKALMEQGLSNRDIAKQLGLSDSAVSLRIKHIKEEG